MLNDEENTLKSIDEYQAKIVGSLLRIKTLPEEIPENRRFSVKKMLKNEKQFFKEIESLQYFAPIVLGIEQFDHSWTEKMILNKMAEINYRFNKDIYLAVPLRDQSRIDDLIISMAEEIEAYWNHNKAMFKDDYVIRIVDQRNRSKLSFIKLYPTGEITLHMYWEELPAPIKVFQIDTVLLEKAKIFAKDLVNSICNTDKESYLCHEDDRVFLECYRMECGFAWLGKKADPYITAEFFVKKSKYPIINEIMDLPQLAVFTVS